MLSFLDGPSIDVAFASGGQKWGSIRFDSRMAKLESKVNYKAKPALCALIRDAQRGEYCGCCEIDAVRYLPADAARCGAMRSRGRQTPGAPLSSRFSIRI